MPMNSTGVSRLELCNHFAVCHRFTRTLVPCPHFIEGCVVFISGGAGCGRSQVNRVGPHLDTRRRLCFVHVLVHVLKALRRALFSYTKHRQKCPPHALAGRPRIGHVTGR